MSYEMTLREAADYIRGQEPAFLQKASVRGYICPACRQGATKGNGLTRATGRRNSWHCINEQREYSVLGLWAAYAGIPDTRENYADIVKGAAAYYGIEVTDSISWQMRTGQINFTEARQRAKAAEAALSASKENTMPDTGTALKTANNEAAEARKPAHDFTEYYKICRERLEWPEAVAYLQRRGISIETARTAGAGYDPEADPANAPGATGDEKRRFPSPRIIIPSNKGHYVARAIRDNDKMPKLNPKGCRPGMFSRIKAGLPYVFVTEGIFDALAILEAGKPVIALNSTQNKLQFIALAKKSEYLQGKTFILCLDADEAGRNAQAEILEALTAAGIRATAANISGEYKDANEALTHDRKSFFEALERAILEAMKV